MCDTYLEITTCTVQKAESYQDHTEREENLINDMLI